MFTHGIMNCHTMKGPMVSHEKFPVVRAMLGVPRDVWGSE